MRGVLVIHKGKTYFFLQQDFPSSMPEQAEAVFPSAEVQHFFASQIFMQSAFTFCPSALFCASGVIAQYLLQSSLHLSSLQFLQHEHVVAACLTFGAPPFIAFTFIVIAHSIITMIELILFIVRFFEIKILFI